MLRFVLPIVVRDFAIALNLKPFQVIGSLMELGKVVSLTSVIEETDAKKVAEKHGYHFRNSSPR
jgi:hypothetical protein